ncbi:hypothetical protein LOD99_12609 [Oopsacas minuta]|uniref:Uncharacterized protein n=1 Tax=Oopsacas minuta TaxID=111878 RepID=A0AAV7JCL0_9METZ|nr:hypothetical protein LOD99_12609 [Oopsacas minuta]
MIKVAGQDIIQVTLEELTSSIDTLKTTNYHEVEEYREHLNHLDVVRLAASSLIQTDTVRSIGSSENLIQYKMDMSKLMQFTCLICIWEDMAGVLLSYTTDMRISLESQKQCYKSLRDMVRYSLNDTQLFSVMFRKLEYTFLRIDNPAQNNIDSDNSELVGDLGKRWNNNRDCSFDIVSNNMQYWNNNDIKKLKLALQREKRVLCVEQLAIKCYTFWRQLIPTDIGDEESKAMSFQIGDRLIFLQRVSCELVRGIEVLFRIISCLENGRLNSFEKIAFDVIGSAFVLIELVNRILKKKSTIPNKIIEFVWLVLAIEPNQQLLTNIHDLLHKVIPKFVKRELGFNSGNSLEELIDFILFYCTRCIQQDKMDICNEVTSLYKSVIDMSRNSLHCTFISECFRFAAFSMKSSIHDSADILAVITKITNKLFHPSDRYRSTTIKLLVNLCTEICLAGENPVSYLQLLIDVVAPIEICKCSQGLTRLVRDFVIAVTIKLNRNCISIHDTIRILVPSVSQIVNQLNRIPKITRALLTVECCTKLITHVSSIHDFEILLCHGLLLIQHVVPDELTIQKASCFFKKLINRFLNRKDTYLLQLAYITYEKFIKQFQTEYVEINTLFYYLLTEAPLAKISHIYHACQSPILENKRLSGLRSIFYLRAMEPVILKIFADISTALCFMQNNKYQSLSYPMEDLMYSFVADILEVIQAEQTEIHIWNHLYERVMQVSFIFIGTADAELDNSNCYKGDLLHLLDVEMPVQLRQLIVTIMKRIIYLDMDGYSQLQSKLAQLMVNSMYLNKNTQKKSENDHLQFNMVNVLESIQENLLVDKFNQNTIKKLISSGYSSKLFKYNIQQQAQTYSHHIATNEQKQNTFILSHYREFQHIIKTLHIGVYWFSHNKVYVHDIFKGELSPELFQDRLRYAKMYLFKFVNKGKKYSQHLKAIQALEQERNYKHNLKSKNLINSRHTLTITLLTQFYHTLISSSDTIDHSIRPLGAHNEIPLEIAIRQDRGIVSIRDSYSNIEVEICEVIFMSEGMYVMESQTNGEGINTTQVWCQLFAKLLTTDHLVPSIILPKGNPNMNTWVYVNKSIRRESINSNLTWSPYYSYEWITYYPKLPNKVHAMEDIVLHPGYKVYTGGLAQRMTPVWRRRTDLVGILFYHVLTTLSQKYLTSVYCNYSDYIYSFLKDYLNDPDDQKYNKLNTDLEGEILIIVHKWILSVNIEKLFQKDSKSFFELKYFLDAHSATSIKKYKDVRAEIKIRILDSFHIFVLNELPFEIQKASILWIEQLDENLWLETERLEEPFRYLINQTEQGLKFFPGVVSFFLPQYRDRSSIPITADVLTPDKISGYVVGKVIELNLSYDVLNNDRTRNNQLDGKSVETFEMWGSWVGPKYRRLGIAVDMYRYTFKVLPTQYLTVDMNEGVQWKCAINAKIGSLFIWLGIVDYIMDNIVAKEVASRWNFYLGGADRNFQRYLLNNKFMKPLVYIDTAMNYCNKKYARWRRKKSVKFMYIWVIIVILLLILLLIM